jgi:hypothetical protein
MKFRRMSLRLLDVDNRFEAKIYFTEIISMSPSEQNDVHKLRSSPVCGEVEYINENKSVTPLRLRQISQEALGERILCYVTEKGSKERYLLFSRNAALILNNGNLRSRTTALLAVDGDPNRFIPEDIEFDNSIILESLDRERILVVSSHDPAFRLGADLMLGGYTVRLEKQYAAARYRLGTGTVEQPKEVLAIKSDTYSHGLEVLERYLPYVGIWSSWFSGLPTW